MFILLFAVILPIQGLYVHSFHSLSAEFIDTSYIAAGLLMSFSLIYQDINDCLFGVKAFLLSTRMLSILIIIIYTFSLLGSSEWISFFTERDTAIISFRLYSGVQLPYIYFLASPLLILLMAYDFSKIMDSSGFRAYIPFSISSLSLLLSGTRAHIILAIFFAPIYMLLRSKFKLLGKSILILLLVLSIGLIFGDGTSLVSSFFSPTEASNSIKLSILSKYLEIYSHPIDLIFGQGFNAHEWSANVRQMVAMDVGASKTELTYLELIRVFGLFIGTTVIIALVQFTLATKSLPGCHKWIYPGLIIYLVNAALNPYLFSVNGMLPLGLFSAILFYSRRSRQELGSVDYTL